LTTKLFVIVLSFGVEVAPVKLRPAAPSTKVKAPKSTVAAV
jgi:hypothetical protein